MSLRDWAIRLITYPVLLVLALIFIGPTIPIDMSILIITAIVAMLGLSKEPHALFFGLRSYLAGWRRSLLKRIRL